jgi:hypothetical protein
MIRFAEGWFPVQSIVKMIHEPVNEPALVEAPPGAVPNVGPIQHHHLHMTIIEGNKFGMYTETYPTEELMLARVGPLNDEQRQAWIDLKR